MNVDYDTERNCHGETVGPLDLAVAKTALNAIGLDRLIRAVDHLSSNQRSIPEVGGFLWVPRRGAIVRIAIGSVRYVQADRDYVYVHDGDRSYLIRATISAMADRLGDNFVRIHRSIIVAIPHVTGVRHVGSGAWVAMVDGDFVLPIGRKYLAAVRALLEIRPFRPTAARWNPN